jgi:hypothetical protein
MGTFIALTWVGRFNRFICFGCIGWLGWLGHTHKHSSKGVLRVHIATRGVITPCCQLVAARDDCGEHPSAISLASKGVPFQGFQTERSDGLASNFPESARCRPTEECHGLSLLSDEGALSQWRVGVALNFVQWPA